jgi:hypothetical protein
MFLLMKQLAVVLRIDILFVYIIYKTFSLGLIYCLTRYKFEIVKVLLLQD